jgi:hypothetical protein
MRTEPSTTRPLDEAELARRLARVYAILLGAARKAESRAAEQHSAAETGAPQSGESRGELPVDPVESQVNEIDGSVKQGDRPPSTAPNDVSGRVPR